MEISAVCRHALVCRPFLVSGRSDCPFGRGLVSCMGGRTPPRSSGADGAANAHVPIIFYRRRREVRCRRFNDSEECRREWSTQKGRARGQKQRVEFRIKKTAALLGRGDVVLKSDRVRR